MFPPKMWLFLAKQLPSALIWTRWDISEHSLPGPARNDAKPSKWCGECSSKQRLGCNTLQLHCEKKCCRWGQIGWETVRQCWRRTPCLFCQNIPETFNHLYIDFVNSKHYMQTDFENRTGKKSRGDDHIIYILRYWPWAILRTSVCEMHLANMCTKLEASQRICVQ